MDSFDDLLGTSRAALEENPFADNPFSRPRSGSPDPWATPFGTTDAADAFGSSASHFANSDTFVSHSSVFETPIATKPGVVSPPDPLDSATHHEDTDDTLNEPLAAATLRSPGFLESLPSITTDIKPKKEPEVTLSQSLLDEGIEETSPSVKKDKNHLYIPEGLETPTKSGSSVATFQTASSNVAFKSPLDPTPSVLERSITGFSIGGEALGGWQAHTEERLAWHQHDAVPTASQPSPSLATPALPSPAEVDDDDSDDDKPIMQALQEKQQREASTVSVYFSKCLQY